MDLFVFPGDRNVRPEALRGDSSDENGAGATQKHTSGIHFGFPPFAVGTDIG
jgi:hypothetical protein